MREHLVTVFAREPALGQVKTRLAASLGQERALELYTWLGARIVRGLLAPSDRRYDLHVTFTPEDARDALRAWLGPVDDLFPQPDADLGGRMRHAVARGLSLGYRSVTLVGTDCAALTPERAHEALDALALHDAALGPATDGGYYLLALKELLPVFESVAWSTVSVTPTTRARLASHGARWFELPTERDLDTDQDLPSLAHLPDRPSWLYPLC